MKKVVFILFMLLVGTSYTFAQYNATVRVPDIDITGLNAGDTFIIPFIMDSKTAGGLITGFQTYIDFDHTIMSWNGTFADPTPGVSYFNPLMPYNGNGNDWTINDNVGENAMFAFWMDPNFAGVDVPDGETFIAFIFTYNGGLNPGESSPLTMSLTKNVGGKITNKGATEMYDQNFGYYNLTLVNGSIYVGSSGSTWTGAVSSDWFDGGNWNPAGVPADGTDIDIPAGVANMPMISGAIATTGVLNVAAGATLTVAADGGLTTQGLFTNDGMFYILSENGSGYAGTFIDEGGMAGSGTFDFTRQMLCTGTTPGSTAAAGWHYLASPVDGFTTDDIPDYFVNAWNQGTGMWDQYWVNVPCTPYPTTGLAAMDAWSVNYYAGYPDTCSNMPAPTGMDIEFTGTMADVHTGAYNKAFSYGATGYQNWEMFANPYPSGLDLGAVTWDANMVAGAAFYDGCAGNYEYYSPTVPGTNQIVAPGEGFFTETTAAGTLSYAGTERAHNADWFWKSDVSYLLTLEVAGNDRSDKTYIRFMEDKTPGFDNNGDFHKLFSTEAPQIYTLAGEDKLAINALPACDLVHMGFTANVSGTYTISAIEANDFANVVLEDTYTGIETDMLTDDYTFDYTVGSDPNRFIVHFTPLGTPELEANSIRIWASERNIYVSVPETVSGDVAVYNMMGQEVVANKVIPGMNVIPVNDVNTYYVVKVMSDNNVKTEKVFIR